MNRRNGNKDLLLEDWMLRFLGTGILFLAAVFLISSMLMIEAMAATIADVSRDSGEEVISLDSDGEEAETADTYFYTKSKVRFELPGIPAGESAWQVSYDNSGEWSVLFPMEEQEDGSFLEVTPGEHEYVRLRFFRLPEGQEPVQISSCLFYGIRFDLTPETATTAFAGEGTTGSGSMMYLRGKNPVLKVTAGSAGNTVVSVTKEEQQSEIPVEGTLSLEFEEGEYEVSVYDRNEETGEEQQAEGFPIHFLYDRTPPEGTAIQLAGSLQKRYADSGSEEVLTGAGEVTVKVTSKDLLSGVDRIYIRAGGKVKCASTLKLSPGFEGMVETWAVDKCGNESAHVRNAEKIVLEDTAPKVSISCSKKGSGISAECVMEDGDTGIAYGEGSIGGATLFRRTFAEDSLGNEQEILRFEIPGSYLTDGDQTVTILCRDGAGNESVTEYPVVFRDLTGPRITIAGVSSGAVVADALTLEAQVRDANPDPEGVTLTGTRTLGGETYQIKRTGEEGFAFAEDGHYELTVSAADTLGNTGTKSVDFTIDTTPPQISIPKQVSGNCLDSFCAKDLVGEMIRDETPVRYSLYLNGRDYDENETVKKPGDYSFRVYALDMAGNRSEQTVSFRIGDAGDEASGDGEMPEPGEDALGGTTKFGSNGVKSGSITAKSGSSAAKSGSDAAADPEMAAGETGSVAAAETQGLAGTESKTTAAAEKHSGRLLLIVLLCGAAGAAAAGLLLARRLRKARRTKGADNRDNSSREYGSDIGNYDSSREYGSDIGNCDSSREYGSDIGITEDGSAGEDME